jgi:hypothetical protein
MKEAIEAAGEVLAKMKKDQMTEEFLAKRKTWMEVQKKINMGIPLDGVVCSMGSFAIDVIKLDEILGVPDGVSTAEFIEQKWGKDIMEQIRSLL